MAYVSVKGGERAIDNAHRWLDEKRRGDPLVAELLVDQIREQLSLAVDRVMAEGSCHDPELAALAIKQARGDITEAIFLLRAYRTTLPRFGFSEPLKTGDMAAERRVSAAFKDIPGGQILGPTFDYTHRLINFDLARPGPDPQAVLAGRPLAGPLPAIASIFAHEALLELPEADPEDGRAPHDLTREPLSFPAGRDQRLQALARGDEGFLLSLAYASQRGWGNTHPLCGEIRLGQVVVEYCPEELGFPVAIGEITVTECQMISNFEGSADRPPQFTCGYGLVFGHNERKAMSMAIVDRALRHAEAGEAPAHAVQDEEFVLYHADNVEASGFVQHLKLPHYVDFQAELQFIRRLRREWQAARADRQSPLTKAAE